MVAPFNHCLTKRSTASIFRQLADPRAFCNIQKPDTRFQRSSQTKNKPVVIGRRFLWLYQKPSHAPQKELGELQDTQAVPPRPAIIDLYRSLNPTFEATDHTRPDLQTVSLLLESADPIIRQQYDEVIGGKLAGSDGVAAWVEIVSVVQRVHGLQSVVQVWRPIRLSGIDLPTEGDQAESLWNGILGAALAQQNGQLLMEIWEYVKDLKSRTGDHYSGLYKLIVGRCLRFSPSNAGEWHDRLTQQQCTPSDALKSVAVDAMANNKNAFSHFRILYERSEKRNLYNTCIATALTFEDRKLLIQWHRMFLKNGDGPSQEYFFQPEVQRIFDIDRDASLPMKKNIMHRMAPPNAKRPKSSRNIFPAFTRTSMNSLVGSAHGIKPVEISDNFCARLFATQSFSTDLVIQGLNILAVERIGPLALREMAARTPSPAEFLNMVNFLRTKSIAVDVSNFSKLVFRVARDQNLALWSALIESDIHPQTFEDFESLKAIATPLLKQKRHQQANLVLLALSMNGQRGVEEAWNFLLQHHLSNRDFGLMMPVLQSIQENRVRISRETLGLFHRIVLPPREPHKTWKKGTVPESFDPVKFVTKVFMYAADHGCFVHWKLWVEQMKRYGGTDRWDELERLVIWLLDRYPHEGLPYNGDGATSYVPRRVALRHESILQSIFRPKMQQALFLWGFRAASKHHQLRPRIQPASELDDLRSYPLREGVQAEPWARGLALLKILKTHGIYLNMLYLRRVFVTRMWILFGPGVSDVGLNNEARRRNHLGLAQFITHANEIFEKFVYWVPSDLLEPASFSDPRLLTHFFRDVRRATGNTYADVEGWAAVLKHLDSPRLHEGHSKTKKRRSWRHSRLRLTKTAVKTVGRKVARIL